jgi:hypothetical protein
MKKAIYAMLKEWKFIITIVVMIYGITVINNFSYTLGRRSSISRELRNISSELSYITRELGIISSELGSILLKVK